MKNRIKYLSRISEYDVERVLQNWIDDGWHWWPQTFHADFIDGEIYWSFILSKQEEQR